MWRTMMAASSFHQLSLKICTLRHPSFCASPFPDEESYLSYPRIVEEEIKMEDEGALFPTACKKGWLQVRSKKAFHTWKRRWVVLTTDKLHILRKIGVRCPPHLSVQTQVPEKPGNNQDTIPLQSIPLDNLLMNTPIKDQGKKFLLFLYHAPPTTDPSAQRAPASGNSASVSLKEKRLKTQETESAPRRGQRGELLDLNDRVRTL